jgi:hypothetical protein
MRKITARSWTFHNNAVHSFFARDRSHPQSKDIYAGLEVLILECIKAGYTYTTFVLHDVEEYQKRHFLMYHSAKLAAMYGILTAGTLSCNKTLCRNTTVSLCHYWSLRVRVEHTKTTGCRGKTDDLWKKR